MQFGDVKKSGGLTWNSRRSFVTIIRGNGAPGPTIAPFALATHVVTGFIHFSGTPCLVFCQMGHVPDARVVGHAVESKGENAGQMGRGPTFGGTHFIRRGRRGCKKQ